jgi:hypothetical protein
MASGRAECRNAMGEQALAPIFTLDYMLFAYMFYSDITLYLMIFNNKRNTLKYVKIRQSLNIFYKKNGRWLSGLRYVR